MTSEPHRAVTRGTFRVARLRGVDVLVRPGLLLTSVVLVALFVPRLDDAGVERPLLVGALIVASIYLSVLVHELAHVVIARAHDMQVQSVTLHMLGGETLIEGESRRPGQEFWTSIAGPVASAAIGTLALLAARGAASTAADLLWALGWINLLVAAFNMLPALPLDGGRVVRALIWAVSGREAIGIVVTAWIGRLAAIGAVGLGVWFAMSNERTKWIDLVVCVLVAAFLWQGAGQSLRIVDRAARIERLDAASLAESVQDCDDVGSLPALPLRLRGEALLRAMAGTPSERYRLVDDDGRLRGILHSRSVDRAYRSGGRR